MPHNRSSRIPPILAAIFLIAAIGFALRSAGYLNFNPSQTPAPDTPQDLAGIARLDEIETFESAETPQRAASIANQIADHALDKLSQQTSAEGARLPNEDQLRDLVRERVRLTLDPDYDEYTRHVAELLSRDAAEALKGTMFEDPNLWNAFAQRNRQAQIAIKPTHAILERGDLPTGVGLQGGQRASITDPGIYNSTPLAESGALRVDINIPMTLPPNHDAPDASVMTVFVTMSFVHDPQTGIWLPYKTTTTDPSGTYEQMAAMWI